MDLRTCEIGIVSPEIKSGDVRCHYQNSRRLAALSAASPFWCHSFFFSMRQSNLEALRLPLVLGYDVVGKIDQLGEAVTGFVVPLRKAEGS